MMAGEEKIATPDANSAYLLLAAFSANFFASAM